MRHLSSGISKLQLAALLVPAALAYSSLGYAALESQVKDIKLNSVTVFLRGAELFNSAQVSLPAGESEIVFTNIASNINEKTLIIGTDSQALIKSSQIRRNYLAESVDSEEMQRLNSQIDELQENRRYLLIEQQTIETQLRLLEQNLSLTNDKDRATVDDIRSLWNFIDTQMKDALKNRTRLAQELADMDKKIGALQRQIQERQAKGRLPGNQLVVKFHTKQAVNANVNLSYAITDANWVPSYDVAVDKINGPIKFIYKASVAQASGIDWNNVHLKLSTGNLSQSAQAPTLKPNYLSVIEARNYYNGAGRAKMAQNAPVVMEAISSDLSYEAGEAKQESAPALKRLTLNDYVATDISGVNTTFNIALPYSIPSDSNAHLVAIKEEQTAGDYRYFVVPKVNNSVFLQVQIADWQRLNLLPGKSNVFFEGSFIGEGYINPADISDEMMNISLGRDNKIIVERNNVSGMKNKPTFFGNNMTQDFGYTIDVHNSRPEPIKLMVVDQIPVSRDESISINDVKLDNQGTINKESGELSWLLNLSANGAQKLRFSYTVKYPKDKNIRGL
jgi:uncharacterized protein (TIGR02231 family)